MEYDFELDFSGTEISSSPIADEMREVLTYIRDVATYMEIDPKDLVCQILMEWAYRREIK